MRESMQNLFDGLPVVEIQVELQHVKHQHDVDLEERSQNHRTQEVENACRKTDGEGGQNIACAVSDPQQQDNHRLDHILQHVSSAVKDQLKLSALELVLFFLFILDFDERVDD